MPKKVIPPAPAENTSPVSAMLEGREVDPEVLTRPIDDRMKALLKDHQEMGARPMKEPRSGDLYDPTLPLRETGPSKAELGLEKTEDTTPESKKASKSKK